MVSSTIIGESGPETVIKHSQSFNLKRKILLNDSNKRKTKHYQFKGEYSS